MLHIVLELLCGLIIGFTLGLIGGGGSILAVPLMVYVVGVKNPHVAIGTSAMAVAVNALAGVISHARAGTVKWRCAAIFEPCGVIGALGGAALGKRVDGQHLLVCFALLMVVVGVLMLRGRRNRGIEGAACNRQNAPKVMGGALGTGFLSGFFGIGGGFLIVPTLVACTDMPILYAIGTSLVAVAAFGASTALSYMLSGFVDWTMGGLFIAGGVVGSFLGMRAARRLSGAGETLTVLFATVIFVVAAYMLWRCLAVV
ncbi:sulfite exporter TauE/SafE family protein [Gluconobacter morbifer]|uniref:Probable membrane transporter protein n=1 Tax=Gluconobacter morbifer G707 TaxID=1088869 RepID=G6XF96_9PROT|nr:sulfite exporter TauE/SafE family protein [Gluconobacter morbifer]EHH68854.1 hypothetical protein GMO_01610 [Gluconobacter morbifer G707]